MWRNSKEDKVGVKKAKSPPGDIVDDKRSLRREDSREELTRGSGLQSLL